MRARITGHGPTLLTIPALMLAGALGRPSARCDEPSGIEATARELIGALERASPDERRLLTRRLIELGPDAFEETRRAREAAGDPEARRALARAATWQIAASIVPVLRAGLETQLTFDGQYESLRKYGEEGTRAILALVDDSATPFELRLAACHALADTGDSSLLPALRELKNDILLPYVLREQVGILLAIFGDTHAVDREIRQHLRYARDRNPAVRLEASLQLSNLYYRIRNYAKAVEYYEEIIAIYEAAIEARRKDGSPRALVESLERQLTLHYYNAACSNSLHGDVERSREYLRRAVSGDPSHYENMEKDGDLRRLRAHPGHAEFRRELGRLFEGEDL